MGYIYDNLLHDEHLIYAARPHWILFMSSIGLFVLATLMKLFGPNIFPHFWLVGQLSVSELSALLLLFVSIVSFVIALITYSCSEYGVTNKRVLMKTGWIRRQSLEIFLPKIESIMVYQGVIGRLLGYGTVTVTGLGGSNDVFFYIPKPLLFRKKVQEQINRV